MAGGLQPWDAASRNMFHPVSTKRILCSAWIQPKIYFYPGEENNQFKMLSKKYPKVEAEFSGEEGHIELRGGEREVRKFYEGILPLVSKLQRKFDVVNAVVHVPQALHEDFQYPKGLHNERVSKIRKEADVLLDIPDGDDGPSDEIKIEGPRQGVAKAKERLLALVEEIQRDSPPPLSPCTTSESEAEPSDASDNEIEIQKEDENNENECGICLENVPSVKVLPCGHESCLLCLRKILSTKKICPLCRKSAKIPAGGIEAFPTKYFGTLTCQICNKDKDAFEFWWCPTCIMIFCSRCDVAEHQKLGHRIAEWNSREPITAASAYLESFVNEKGKEPKNKEPKKSRKTAESPLVDNFVAQIKTEFLSELGSLAKRCDGEDSDKIQRAIDLIREKYGIAADEKEAKNPVTLAMITDDNADMVGRQVQKMIGLEAAMELGVLVTQGSGLAGFAIAPEKFAGYLYQQAEYK